MQKRKGDSRRRCRHFRGSGRQCEVVWRQNRIRRIATRSSVLKERDWHKRLLSATDASPKLCADQVPAAGTIAARFSWLFHAINARGHRTCVEDVTPRCCGIVFGHRTTRARPVTVGTSGVSQSCARRPRDRSRTGPATAVATRSSARHSPNQGRSWTGAGGRAGGRAGGQGTIQFRILNSRTSWEEMLDKLGGDVAD